MRSLSDCLTFPITPQSEYFLCSTFSETAQNIEFLGNYRKSKKRKWRLEQNNFFSPFSYKCLQCCFAPISLCSLATLRSFEQTHSYLHSNICCCCRSLKLEDFRRRCKVRLAVSLTSAVSVEDAIQQKERTVGHCVVNFAAEGDLLIILFWTLLSSDDRPFPTSSQLVENGDNLFETDSFSLSRKQPASRDRHSIWESSVPKTDGRDAFVWLRVTLKRKKETAFLLRFWPFSSSLQYEFKARGVQKRRVILSVSMDGLSVLLRRRKSVSREWGRKKTFATSFPAQLDNCSYFFFALFFSVISPTEVCR